MYKYKFLFLPLISFAAFIFLVGCGQMNSGSLQQSSVAVPVNDDPYNQYALTDGRLGGQLLYGGINASESLTLDSTTSGTKGFVLLAPTGGNVGIGTLSPNSKLQVSGGTLRSTLNGYGTSFISEGLASGSNFKITHDATGFTKIYNSLATGDSYGLSFMADDGATDILTLTNAGKVGIGTASPQYVLHVKSSSDSIVTSEGTNGYGSFHAVGSGTNNSYVFFGNAGGEKNRITSADDGTMVFSTGAGATERMRVSPVGAAVQVTGNMSATGNISTAGTLQMASGYAVAAAASGIKMASGSSVTNASGDATVAIAAAGFFSGTPTLIVSSMHTDAGHQVSGTATSATSATVKSWLADGTASGPINFNWIAIGP